MPSLFIDTERLRDLTSGLGQVCLHLGRELIRQRPEGWTVTFLVPKGQEGVFGDDVSYVEASWWRKIWLGGRYDVWHCLHQDSIYLPLSPTKLILTIHDLNFLDRPDYPSVKKARKLSLLQRRISRISALTAISEFTASVVREHLHVAESLPLQVIYNGNSLAALTIPVQETASTIRTDRPFFLSVGVIHPKKNVHVLLPFLEAFPDYQLILAGPDGHPYAQHVLEQAQKIGVADRLLMPGAVDEPTKIWLYAHCEAFLFPSLSEGFGLPVVEAMSFGKPVFCSNLTSLPEIGGREAVYFTSFEPDEMVETFRQGMMDYHDDPLKADRLRWQANRFSWEKAAKAYWALYQEVLK